MQPVAHIHDLLDPSHGGYIIEATTNIVADGRVVARVNDEVLCYKHGKQKIVTGSGVMMYDGRPVAMNTSLCSCGARVVSASCLIVSE